MEKEEFLRLLRKYRAGKASAEEEKFLQAYYNLLGGGTDLMEGLSELEKESIRREIKKNLDSRIAVQENAAAKKKRFSVQKFAAAAAILIVLSAGLYFYANRSKPEEQPASGNKTAANDISPGGNKAILILADGSKVILNDLESGTQISQGNTAVSKTKDGQLVYDVSAKPLTAANSPSQLTYNTITTPRGGQYMVILPDGTKVWLNAESSLRFPTAFSEKERKVELSGEAYFEVAKAPLNPPKREKHQASGSLSFGEGKGEARLPFIVISGEQRVEVLGTHFNINAYADEPAVKTTLLEGSVKISNLKSHISPKESIRTYLLMPGQQSSMGKEGRIKIAAVNTEEVIAWKNGYFLFNNEPLESIMRKVSKWYDVEVDYQGNTRNLYFGGMVSRSKNISAVLRIMELTGDVHFRITGDKERRVVVMP